MRAFGKGLQALALMPELLATFQWCEERMLRSVSVQMLATDRALDMANEGLPFREAYRRVAADMEDGDTEGVQKSVLNRISPGACGNLDTNLLQDRIKTILNHPD
jgi:argininosuccinate lyase